MADGEINESQALWISLGIWFLLLVLYSLGYDSNIVYGLGTVSAFIFGFLAHKLGVALPKQGN